MIRHARKPNPKFIPRHCAWQGCQEWIPCPERGGRPKAYCDPHRARVDALRNSEYCRRWYQKTRAADAGVTR